ncbi:SKP1-like protein 5 [Oryza glaberrima]|uniref:SKP1-like protein 5 n=1 Tax=Oryza glaberrima TaxID=4538 RepID=UPI00224C1C31|nr:SKP1-like protein 5 [Oryza glaberrima]
MVMAMAMEAAPAPVPLPLVLRFRNGEDRFALTDQPRQLPLGYAIDAPSIRSARTFGLLDEYARVHAQHARGDPGAVPDIAAWDRAFMEREFTATDELHDLFMAASTLEMDGLSVLCAQKTADVVKKRTVEEVKALLGIADVGMTPEEELKLQHDNDAILCLH